MRFSGSGPYMSAQQLPPSNGEMFPYNVQSDPVKPGPNDLQYCFDVFLCVSV